MKDKDGRYFKEGDIYMMNVGARSRTDHPYYVEIIEVGSNHIITNIPNYHSLKISTDNNASYHLPRLEYVGRKEHVAHFLSNQEGLYKQSNHRYT